MNAHMTRHPRQRSRTPAEPTRRRRGLAAVGLGLVLLAATAGCTGPVRSDRVYAAKAASDAGDIQSTFDAIQPPDGRADGLRDQLDSLLGPAVSTLEDLRTAARRGDVAQLPSLARPLPRLGDRLQQFQKAHQ